MLEARIIFVNLQGRFHQHSQQYLKSMNLRPRRQSLKGG
jgi:hypothetical protein